MSVYFARVGRYIKVGYSESPERRVANLFKSATRYSAPRDIDATTPRTLLAAVPGGSNKEGLAHLALDDFRVLGEWFIDESEVRDYTGDYWWGDDPVLAPTAEEREAEALLVQNMFAGTSLGTSTPQTAATSHPPVT